MNLHWYFGNMICGLKTAFFISSSQRMKASWRSLVAIVATVFLFQFMLECFVIGEGAAVTYFWYMYHSAMLALVLAGSFLICFDEDEETQVIAVATAFYNSYFIIFIPYVLVNLFRPSWYEEDVEMLITYGMMVWAFMVMFRIVSEYVEPYIYRMIGAGLAAAGILFLLNDQLGYRPMIYNENEETQEEVSPLDNLTSEQLFDLQPTLRERDISALTASKPGKVDIYGFVLGSYSYQDVFMREALFVEEQLRSVMGVQNTMTMINNKKTVWDYPLANATNLRAALTETKEHLMQPDEDIALIYLTSHGDPNTGLAVDLDYQFSMMNISPTMLSLILKGTGIKNTIVIISACYSGVFIPPLQDENTMVITSAARDKPSYGCSQDASLTYFAEALFEEGLGKTTDLEQAFYVAKEAINQREIAEKIEVKSDPQIFIGERIKGAMSKYQVIPVPVQYGPPSKNRE